MVATRYSGLVERETGIEPATLCLGSRCSTAELLPLTLRLGLGARTVKPRAQAPDTDVGGRVKRAVS